MNERIIGMLASPERKGALALSANKAETGEAPEGSLSCRVYQCTYALRNSIPRFVESDRYVKNTPMENPVVRGARA